jgi:DNA polymerase-3 subunit gamma/tau
MALYRTYRPATLDEVVGQEHVTGPLRRALENDRVHHAYLLSGPRGCGKTSTARILARSLNCEQGPTPNPCGECQSCLDLAPNGPGSLDVIELDAASHGGVDDTRDLRERAMFAPATSRYKVYIIDEAHMVSTAGFNALLKLVEEPPDHVRFIFATTEADKVLPTIRSRTHNYTFRLVSAKALQEHLASVCDQEGVPYEPAALALVARAGAGSVRDSLSVLGQVISGSGPAGVTYADAVLQLGMTDAALLDDTIAALADHDGAAMFTVIDRVIEAGHDPRRFVTDLLERLRDLIVLQSVPDAAALGLIDAPEDQLAAEVEQAQRFGLAELTRAADVTSAALSELKGATAPRLHLELMGARLLLPAADSDEAGMRARLDQLERRMASAPIHQAPAGQPPVGREQVSDVTAPEPAASASTSAPASVSASTSKSTRAKPPRLSDVAPSTAAEPAESPTAVPPAAASVEPAEAVVASVAASAPADPAPASAGGATYAPTLDQFVSLWPAVLEALKTYSKVAWLGFSSSRPISYANGDLAVAVRDAGTVKGVKASGHDERLRQAVIDVVRADVRIDVVFAPDQAGAVPSEPSPSATRSNEPASAAPTAGAPSTRAPAAGAPSTQAAAAVEPDAPSMDDDDLDDSSGVDLAMREFGATQIGEIEH